MALGPNSYVTIVLTLDGTYQQLSLSGTVSTKTRTPVKSVSFQLDTAASAVAYIAGRKVNGDVPSAAGDYSVQIPAPASTVPAAPYILGDNLAGQPMGALCLEDIFVKGTATDKMRIGVVLAGMNF